MNSTKNELPPYAKTAHFIVAAIGVTYVLYIGQGIILPLLFATLFAILLNPIINFLANKRIPRVLAILLVIIVFMALIGILIFFLVSQASLLSSMVPKLKIQLNTILQQIIYWISGHFNISVNRLVEYLNKSLTDSVSNPTTIIGQTIISISSALIIAFIIPVYVFMILFYKSLILEFISKLFAKERHRYIAVILFDSKILIQNYLGGLFIEFIIVSTLNTISLLIIGVDFAILLGVIGGILNVIPYIGGVVAISIPMIIALSTQSINAAFWVFIAYIIVQIIDNNILMHFIVAGKVKINALASIIAVFVFGAIWGIPGMFVSIPVTAIIKVIFDQIDDLKPYGFMLGDTMPTNQNAILKKLPAIILNAEKEKKEESSNK